MFVCVFGVMVSAPVEARADIITPDQQLLRPFGIRRPSYRDDPRFTCRTKVLDEMAKTQEYHKIDVESWEFKSAYSACIKGKEDRIEAYERASSLYGAAMLVAALLVFVLMPLLVIVWLRKRWRARR